VVTVTLSSPNARKNIFQPRKVHPAAGSSGQVASRRLPIVLFFLLALAPLLLLQSAAHRYVKQSMNEKISQSAVKGLLQAKTLLEMLTLQYEELSIQLQVDFDRQTLIKDYINRQSAPAADQIKEEFHLLLTHAPKIRCLILDSLNNQPTAVNTSVSCLPANVTLVKQSPVYQEALAAPGQICWGVVEQDLAMVRVINDLTSGEPLCVFAAIFHGAEISQLLNPDFKEQSPAAEIPYLVLANAKGTILASPFPEELGITINGPFGKAAKNNGFQNGNGTGSFATRLRNAQHFVTYHYIPSKNLYLLSLAPDQYWFKEIDALRTPVFLLILLLGAIFAVLLAYALSASAALSRHCTLKEAAATAPSAPEKKLAQR